MQRCIFYNGYMASFKLAHLCTFTLWHLHPFRPAANLTRNPNKSVFGFLRRLSTWHCSRLLLSSVLLLRCCWALVMQQSIDISCSPVAQQQTGNSRVRAGEWCDGRTDGGTPDRYIDPASHTMRAVWIIPPFTKDAFLSVSVSHNTDHTRLPVRLPKQLWLSHSILEI